MNLLLDILKHILHINLRLIPIHLRRKSNPVTNRYFRSTEVTEIQDAQVQNRQQPPYSPNPCTKLAHILGGNLSEGYFQGREN